MGGVEGTSLCGRSGRFRYGDERREGLILIRIRKIEYRYAAFYRAAQPPSAPRLWVVSIDGRRVDSFMSEENAKRCAERLEAAS